MTKLYRGKQKCAGCGRTGEEYPRYDKDGLCLECYEKLKLGREVSEQLQRKRSDIRFDELSDVHMTWYEVPFIHHKLVDFIRSVVSFSTKFASVYGKPPCGDFLLGTPGCGTSYDSFAVPTDSVKPLKELCKAIQDKMIEVRTKEDNMRRDLMKELDMEREEIYNEGVKRGRNLLAQLNSGEITVRELNERQVYRKTKEG